MVQKSTTRRRSSRTTSRTKPSKMKEISKAEITRITNNYKHVSKKLDKAEAEHGAALKKMWEKEREVNKIGKEFERAQKLYMMVKK